MGLQFENQVEVEPIADLIEGDYSKALKGKQNSFKRVFHDDEHGIQV